MLRLLHARLLIGQCWLWFFVSSRRTYRSITVDLILLDDASRSTEYSLSKLCSLCLFLSIAHTMNAHDVRVTLLSRSVVQQCEYSFGSNHSKHGLQMATINSIWPKNQGPPHGRHNIACNRPGKKTDRFRSPMDNALCTTMPHAECSPNEPHGPCLLKRIAGDVTASYTPLTGEMRAQW